MPKHQQKSIFLIQARHRRTHLPTIGENHHATFIESRNHFTPPPQFSANKRRNGLVGAALATTLTAGIGTAVAENRLLIQDFRDSLLAFYSDTTEAAVASALAANRVTMMQADTLNNFIDIGNMQLRNQGTVGNVRRTGCVEDGSRTARNCINAVAAELSDFYASAPLVRTQLNTELGVSVETTDNTEALLVLKIRPAVSDYYLQEHPVPSADDDDDDDAPWAEAIGGAIALSYFANYLIKQTTWQGNLFTYAMPTSDDTFAYGVQFEPNEDWHMRFSVADSSHAETPADPYYRMQVEYRF